MYTGNGEAKEDCRSLKRRRRSVLRPIVRRIRSVKAIRRRRVRVSGGEVETVYSTVVGEGRRVRRYGCTVNISEGFVFANSSLHAGERVKC